MTEAPTAAVETKPITPKKKKKTLKLGGNCKKAAYAILDGYNERSKEDSVRYRVALNKLPAILGRPGASSDDDHFIALDSEVKMLSRQHCRIDFRSLQGHVKSPDMTVVDETMEVDQIVTKHKLPSNGFFTITCLGKNKIVVNGEKLEKGQVAHIQSGDTIKISTLCLYFLLPVETEPGTPPTKKARTESPSKSSSKASQASSTPSSAAAPSPKTKDVPMTKLETLSTAQLIIEMKAAVAAKQWERRQQYVGVTLSMRLLKAAAQSLPEASTTGVSKADLVGEIERQHPWYVGFLKEQLEDNSFQSHMAKALQRTKLEKSGTGRYAKWLLPEASGKSSPKKAPAKPASENESTTAPSDPNQPDSEPAHESTSPAPAPETEIEQPTSDPKDTAPSEPTENEETTTSNDPTPMETSMEAEASDSKDPEPTDEPEVEEPEAPHTTADGESTQPEPSAPQDEAVEHNASLEVDLTQEDDE